MAISPQRAVRGTPTVFEQLFAEEDGTALSPIDPSAYPAVSIVSPSEEVIQSGVAVTAGDGRWRFTWFVPADAEMLGPDNPWRIDWLMVTAGGRQVERQTNFMLIDNIEATPDERSYTNLTYKGNSERALIKFKNAQESVNVTLMDQSGAETDLSSTLQTIQSDGFYNYFVDTPVLDTPGCYIVVWNTRQTSVSPNATMIQQIRVPEMNFWFVQPSLRMLLDKIQKKIGHVQAYSDADLYEYILRGTEYINAVNPITGWTFNNWPSSYGMGNFLLMASAWWGLNAQYLSEAEASFNFCLTGDSLVSTPRGLVTIRELVGEDAPVGLSKKRVAVTTPDGVRYTDQVYRSTADVFEVETINGYTLECTGNEPLLVLDSSLDLVWRDVSDLREGDLVAIDRTHRSVVEDPDVSNAYTKAKSEHYLNSHSAPKYPSEMTPSLARILGYLVAEGSVVSGASAIFSNTDDSILEDFASCVYDVFGLVPHPFGSKVYPSGKNYRCLKIPGVISRKLLYYLGLDYVSAASKSVPWSILQGSDETVFNFLLAYFAGDGCAASIGHLCSSSQVLLHQLQILLARIGIVSKFNKDNREGDGTDLSSSASSFSSSLISLGYHRRTPLYQSFLHIIRELEEEEGTLFDFSDSACFTTTMSGLSWEKYIDTVGLFPEAKVKSAEVHEKSKRYPVRESLPLFIREYIEDTLGKGSSKGWYNCVDGVHRRLKLSFRDLAKCDYYAGKVQYSHLQRYMDHAGDSLLLVSPSLHRKLSTLLGYKFQFERVVSVSPLGERDVFDLCLPSNEDPLNHAFIANGFVVHNSGQTVTLQVDRTAHYEAAMTRLQAYLDKELQHTKRNMLRRVSVGAISTRPYDFGLQSLVTKVQTVNGGQNQVLPMFSRLGLV